MSCLARQRQTLRLFTAGIFSLLILMGHLGCSELVVRDDDPSDERTRKVAARVLLFPLTLGWSEILLSGETARVEDELFVNAYHRQLLALVADKQLSPYDAAQLLLREQALRTRQYEGRRRAWPKVKPLLRPTTPY